MSRLPPLTRDDCNDEQRVLWDRITESRGRQGLEMTDASGSLMGPFHAMALRPKAGEHMAALGGVLRFRNAAPDNLLEIAICTVGAHWRSEFEFWAHRRMAVDAGVDEAALDAIAAGDTKTGIAIMQMEAGLDTGPVLETLETPITANDTSESLHARLADLGATGITAAMARAGEITPVPQPNDGVCYADKIDKAEARIDWTRPAYQVDCHIRGLSPFPGAWFEVDGTRVKVLGATPVDVEGSAGQVMTGAPVIACGTGGVRLERVQRAGKAAMDGTDFMNGGLLVPGQRL